MGVLGNYTTDTRNALEQAAFAPPLDIAPPFGEALKEAYSHTRATALSVSAGNARQEIVQDWLDKFHALTGEALPNPEQLGEANAAVGSLVGAGRADMYRKIKDRYDRYRKTIPPFAPESDLLPLDQHLASQEAEQMGERATAAHERFQRRGPASGLASLIGMIAAGATDPVNILSMALAAPAGGIVRTAIFEAGANAGATAVSSALNYGYRKSIEPGYGLDTAMSEILTAGLGGAVIGGGIRGLAQAWRGYKGQPNIPRFVKDAGNVVESEANIAETSPFQEPAAAPAEIPSVNAETYHREALKDGVARITDDSTPGPAVVAPPPPEPSLPKLPKLRGNPEYKMERFPVRNMLKRAGGVDPDSPLGGELRAMGLTNKTKGLFKRGGLGAADNFPASESSMFSHLPDDGNGYVPETTVLEALRDETHGAPWRTPEQAEKIRQYGLEARNREFEIDARSAVDARMKELGVSGDDELRSLALDHVRRAEEGDVAVDKAFDTLETAALAHGARDLTPDERARAVAESGLPDTALAGAVARLRGEPAPAGGEGGAGTAADLGEARAAVRGAGKGQGATARPPVGPGAEALSAATDPATIEKMLGSPEMAEAAAQDARRLAAENTDLTIETDDGPVNLADALDALDADEAAAKELKTCAVPQMAEEPPF